MESAPEPLRVLSLSTVFPNPVQPNLGTFVQARLEGLARAGAQVDVIAPVAWFDYAARRWRPPRQVPLARRQGNLSIWHPRWAYPPGLGPLHPPLLALQLWPLARRLCAQRNPALLDAHFAFPEGVTAWFLHRWLGRPFTVTLRGNEPRHARLPARRWLIRRALRSAAAVITVSSSLKGFACQLGLPSCKVHVIPNGLDTDVFYPRNRVESRQRWQVSEQDRLIVSVGSLIERKGHHFVIRAVAELRRHQVPARLIIAGGPGREGQYESPLRALVAELGLQDAVVFTGPVPQAELPSLYSAADVLCLASSREGHPNVVQEALGCGCPVVVTAVGAARELVPSEEYGYVIEPDQVEHLAPVLLRALDRSWDRAKIAAWGRRRSWLEVGREVAEVFRAVLAQTAPAT